MFETQFEELSELELEAIVGGKGKKGGGGGEEEETEECCYAVASYDCGYGYGGGCDGGVCY
jgi:bacteriocin-like protein